MDGSSRLRPQNIKNQCNLAVAALNRDDASLGIVESSLDEFAADAALTSSSFDGLKQHMSDYKLIVSSMRKANEADKEDYSKLASAVGSENIDGNLILEQIENAVTGEQIARGQVTYYRMLQNGSYGSDIVQDYTYQINVYENMADTWRDIREECEKKQEEYDRIESDTQALCVVGNLMRNDIMAGLDSFSVTGNYTAGGTALWREKLQDASITETRREILRIEGMTPKRLQNMEELGYMPEQVKSALEMCVTETDKKFFYFLMDGTADSYVNAFEINPNELSAGMTILMADYACHLLEIDENYNSTEESEKRLMDFNNAILASEISLRDATGYYTAKKYRDAYLEKMCLGTDLLLYRELIELAAMERNDQGYDELFREYEKKYALRQLWGTEQAFVAQLQNAGHGLDAQCKIKKLSFRDRLVLSTDEGEFKNLSFNMVFEHFSVADGTVTEETIRSDILENPEELSGFNDEQELTELLKRKENALGEFLGGITLDISLAALNKYIPPLGVVLSVTKAIYNGESPDLTGIENMVSDPETKKKLEKIASSLEISIENYLDIAKAISEFQIAEREVFYEWFGMGGKYRVNSKNTILQGDYLSVVGVYSPDVVRIMNTWEAEGIKGWLPEDVYNESSEEKFYDDLEKEISTVNKSDENLLNNCRRIINGEEDLFLNMPMNEFVAAINEIDHCLNGAIKTELGCKLENL